MRLVGHLHVENRGAGGINETTECRLEILLRGDRLGLPAKSFRNRYEIGVADLGGDAVTLAESLRMIDRAEIGVGPIAFEEPVFPLDHHAEVLVVEQ